MSEAPEPCPFCGTRDLIASGGDDKFVGYWCNNCEARGPNHYGQWEWDDRSDYQRGLEDAAKVAERWFGCEKIAADIRALSKTEDKT